MSGNGHFPYNVEKSAVYTIIGIILLFSASIATVLIAPLYVEKSWISPTSLYQVQMYEVSDPNFFISNSAGTSYDLQFVHHIETGKTLQAYQENEQTRILASKELEKFITRNEDKTMKLTTRVLLLREPIKELSEAASKLKIELQSRFEKEHPDWKKEGLTKQDYQVWELYDPGLKEAFVVSTTDGILENWVEEDFKILDPSPSESWHQDYGVIYVSNPREYRVKHYTFGGQSFWHYDPSGEAIKSVTELTDQPYGFRSRKELIGMGESIYATEGCWYCHTDQTRTLVQDVVLNGSDSYPAPPSSPNEYIYQSITFPGTKRNGPDLSRTGIKRPSRDWHKGHFWSPKTASLGSIMPAFRHFFDFDPRGTSKVEAGIPNHKFEAIYQYLMTKGTRITPPTQAWWLGKDPIKTKEIIDGKKVYP